MICRVTQSSAKLRNDVSLSGRKSRTALYRPIRPSWIRSSDSPPPRKFEVAEEGGRRSFLHLLPGRASDGRVRGDEADLLLRAMLRREPLDHRVRVRGEPHLERTAHLVLAHPVEDEHAARALGRDEAGE